MTVMQQQQRQQQQWSDRISGGQMRRKIGADVSQREILLSKEENTHRSIECVAQESADIT